MRATDLSIPAQMHNERVNTQADYLAGKSSEHIRKRTGLGGTGDAHYANQAQFERAREYALDMDRNDALVGSLVDRAVTNQLQEGFRFRPMTGDKVLDDDIKLRLEAWMNDPRECDHAWEHTFWEGCWYDLRSTYLAGDHFNILTDHGAIQSLEAHRCRSPSGTKQNIIHGVELNGRKKIAYWFTKDPGARRITLGNAQRRERFINGEPVVLQIYNPSTVKRITQSRGITAFHPVFYRLSQFEDIQFAKMVQTQVVSALAWFFERSDNFKGGKTTLGVRADSDVLGDSDSETIEKVRAGTVARGLPGEKLQAVIPGIPNAEYFQFVKLILTEISITLGLPLVIALMDASETNFSGFKGALSGARMGFRVNQKWFTQRKLSPVYRWKIRQWLDLPASQGGFGLAARRNPDIFKHTWGSPRWPYDMEPVKDAQANILKFISGQLSPSQLGRDNGFDWGDQTDEIVDDWGLLIIKAKVRAQEINKKIDDGQPVHWRDVANLAPPKGMSLSGMLPDDEGDDNNRGGNQPARREETANAA